MGQASVQRTDRNNIIGQVAPETMSTLVPLGVIDAILLDLDGVITRTALIHATAWKRLFDELLARRAGGGSYRSFDAIHDYGTIADHPSRLDGMRAFLEARGVAVPDGAAKDGPDAETIHGLARRKDVYFRELLHEEGVEFFPSAIELIESARVRGLKTAVISSSRNCKEILAAADIAGFFDAAVDGEDLDRLGLGGKPGPDIFLEAARRLGLTPGRTAVVEDGAPGIAGARAGDFALAIGVDRRSKPEILMEAGADIVVSDVSELLPGSGPPLALHALNAIGRALEGRRVAVFLDYDGTVTPITDRPEDAVLDEDMRAAVSGLAGRVPVSFVSGRIKSEIKELVGLDNVIYAASSGFDIEGPHGFSYVQEAGEKYRPIVDAAAARLAERIGHVTGVLIENKGFAITVHYRLVSESDFPLVEQAVDEVAAQYPVLRRSTGKKLFELRPRVDWDKGRALGFLLEVLGLEGPDVLAIYLGDDTSDEAALKWLSGRGIGVLVSDTPTPTPAMFRLRTTDEVRRFLEHLGRLLA